MDFAEFLRRLWDPISTPVSLGVGALVTQLWHRYLSRLAVFRWSAWHNRIAIAGAHPQVGRIDVLWNDTPVENLQFCNVELENESSRDFTNVEIKFWYADGTQFLGEGTLHGTAQFLPHAPRYAEILQTTMALPADQRNADNIQYLLTRREYTIPVFNRGTRFGATFLVHPTGLTPLLNVTCDHPGARLYQRSQRPMLLGVVQAHAAWIGLGAGILITAVLTAFVQRQWVIAVLAFMLGALGTLIGVGVIHTRRWIVRTIG